MKGLLALGPARGVDNDGSLRPRLCGARGAPANYFDDMRAVYGARGVLAQTVRCPWGPGQLL